MRNRIPAALRGAAICALSLAFLAGLPLASAAQNTHTLPLVLPASSAGLEGFVRIVNRSFQPGTVRMTAIDDTGERFGPVTLALEAEETVNFRSSDLERGNASKGLPVGVGDGEGDWRLVLETDLDITPLAYIRTFDGFVTSMHDVVPVTGQDHRVLFFNPGSNLRQVSRLRLINPGTAAAAVEVTARDDRGEAAPGGAVRLTLPAGASRTLTAQDLEAGGDGFEGSLGDGAGKWRLSVTSNVPIEAVSLLLSPTGHLANLSSAPEPPATVVPTLPLVLPADYPGLEGFVRIVNRSGQAGTVRMTAIDDTGERFGPVTLALEAEETVNFNSGDLERGNASKGLPVGVEDGEGNWRLELDSALDVVALAYIRTSDGFVTGMHDVVPVTGRNHRVLFFNPGSNLRQVSRLRLVNPGANAAEVTINGIDDDGFPAAGGSVGLTLPAGASRTLTAQDLEAGGDGFAGSLGDGAGKWRLSVTSNVPIEAVSLLRSPSGHLSNLSTETPTDEAPVNFADATLIDSDEGISGRLESRDDVNYYRLTVDEPTVMTLPIDSDEELVVTVFDEQGNVVDQTTIGGAAAARLAGGGEIGEALPLLGVAAVFVMRAGVTYVVRVALSAAARSKAGAVVAGYVVRKVAVKSAIAIKMLLNRAQVRLEWGGMTSYDVKEHLDGDSSVIARSIVSTTPVLSLRTLGGGRISIVAGTEKVLGFTHNPGEASCGTGDNRSLTVKVGVELAWDQLVLGRTIFPSISLGELPITLTRDNAPRRIQAGADAIEVNVDEGRSRSITLTDYIEDPDGGQLTFAVSGVPDGWGVTANGASLTLAAMEGAVDGTMTVTATDPAGDCWNFPLLVRAQQWLCILESRFHTELPGRGCYCDLEPVHEDVRDDRVSRCLDPEPGETCSFVDSCPSDSGRDGFRWCFYLEQPRTFRRLSSCVGFEVHSDLTCDYFRPYPDQLIVSSCPPRGSRNLGDSPLGIGTGFRPSGDVEALIDRLSRQRRGGESEP